MADMRKFHKVPVYRCPGFLAFLHVYFGKQCSSTAKGTSPQYYGCARSLQFLGNFFVVLYQ